MKKSRHDRVWEYVVAVMEHPSVMDLAYWRSKENPTHKLSKALTQRDRRVANKKIDLLLRMECED